MSRARVQTLQLSAEERLRAQIGLSPGALVRLGLPEEAWTRVLHGIASAADVELVSAGLPRVDPPLPPGVGER